MVKKGITVCDAAVGLALLKQAEFPCRGFISAGTKGRKEITPHPLSLNSAGTGIGVAWLSA